jgi:hypothetical protein
MMNNYNKFYNINNKMPSRTNPEEEETVDAPGNDGNASIPEQVKRPNAWWKMMMIIINNT